MLIYPVIAIVSASGLILQISLTRVFAVGQWYHYAFLSVSLAFLGYGASGSLMTLWRERLGRVPLRETLSVAASASGLMAFLGYLAVNLIPLIHIDCARTGSAGLPGHSIRHPVLAFSSPGLSSAGL